MNKKKTPKILWSDWPDDFRNEAINGYREIKNKPTVNTNQLPTQFENPKGLHQKYLIKKIVPNPDKGTDYRETPEFITQDVDPESEYFVLRLDKNCKDKNHIEACRKAVIAYAVNIEPFIPELAKDLIERYGK